MNLKLATPLFAALCTLLVSAGVLSGTSAAAADGTIAAITLRVLAADVPAGDLVSADASLTGPGGSPAAGAAVSLVSNDGLILDAVTGPDGVATFPVPGDAGTRGWTASSGGALSNPVTVTGHTAAAALTVTPTQPGIADSHGFVTAHVTRTPFGGVPAAYAGGQVTWQRATGDQWDTVTVVALDPTGKSRVAAAPGRWRATLAGTATTEAAQATTVVKAPAKVSLTVSAPKKMADETTVRVQVRVAGTQGQRAVLALQAATRNRWVTLASVRTGNRTYRFPVSPRTTTRYRVSAALSGQTVRTVTSRPVRVQVVSPVPAFRRPPGAPAPRVTLPAQPRATTRGADPVVTGIDDSTWASMVGRSWHAGCPVGRADLRLLRINYYGFDGFRHRGELVASAAAIEKMARGLTLMHDHKVRIRSMYRVDRFGWSARVHGADDYASMAADNTSAFNCRDVVGRPGRLSPHAAGRSLDLNPWENPYLTAGDGWVPNTWWRHHTAGTQTWRRRGDLVVRLMARAGLRWTYGVADAHHFDA